MNQIFRQQGGRRKTRKKRRKKKGGHENLCKLFAETDGIVTKEQANAYCFDHYLDNGKLAWPNWDVSNPELRPANRCSAEAVSYTHLTLPTICSV